MKIDERIILQKRLQNIVSLRELQSGFMPGKRTVDVLFGLKRMEEYREKVKRLYVHVFSRSKKSLVKFNEKIWSGN